MDKGSLMKTSSASWWQQVRVSLDTITEEISRAQRAELVETGHECGHRFEISVRSATHAGVAGEGPESHSDAPFLDATSTIVVRAHNLRDAFLVAASAPLTDWHADKPVAERDDLLMERHQYVKEINARLVALSNAIQGIRSSLTQLYYDMDQFLEDNQEADK